MKIRLQRTYYVAHRVYSNRFVAADRMLVENSAHHINDFADEHLAKEEIPEEEYMAMARLVSFRCFTYTFKLRQFDGRKTSAISK